jgi:hypothetical protein
MACTALSGSQGYPLCHPPPPNTEKTEKSAKKTMFIPFIIVFLSRKTSSSLWTPFLFKLQYSILKFKIEKLEILLCMYCIRDCLTLSESEYACCE